MSSDDAVRPDPLTLRVAFDIDVVLCQRRARCFAADLGFGVSAQWEIAIALSEAARNILKYAGRGVVHLRAIQTDVCGVEFEAVDHGPGIADVQAALEDGITEGHLACGDGAPTTRRGLGLGLGTIRRLMDVVEIESDVRGTRVRAIRWLGRRR